MTEDETVNKKRKRFANNDTDMVYHNEDQFKVPIKKSKLEVVKSYLQSRRSSGELDLDLEDDNSNEDQADQILIHEDVGDVLTQKEQIHDHPLTQKDEQALEDNEYYSQYEEGNQTSDDKMSGGSGEGELKKLRKVSLIQNLTMTNTKINFFLRDSESWKRLSQM